MKVAVLAIGLAWAAGAGAEVLYRLPWADGLSFTFTQVSGPSHFTKATLHAIDIAMPEGVPVVAARAGVAEAVEARYGASPEEEPLTYEGNFVRVRHADGTAASYAHLRYRGAAVTAGERVEAGQLLGYSGATGDVEVAQLRFVVTRIAQNSAGWREEISQPVKFYVGMPPMAFAPRTLLRVSAQYTGAAEPPRMPTESRLLPWKLPALEPGEEPRAWGLLALWLVCGAAGLALFWRFSRS